MKRKNQPIRRFSRLRTAVRVLKTSRAWREGHNEFYAFVIASIDQQLAKVNAKISAILASPKPERAR